MKYAWAVNLHDRAGYVYDEGIYVFVGDSTVIKFDNSRELETFAHEILTSLSELRDAIPTGQEE